MNMGRIAILILLAVVLLRVVMTLNAGSGPRDITLRFHAFVGDEKLALNEGKYRNPGGPGSFRIRDLRFFASNIRVGAGDQQYVEPESYHLVRFDSDEGWFDIRLAEVLLPKIEWIEIGVGVDAEANGTIKLAGDLDPNSRMAWNWETGYKFILLEGMLDLGEGSLPIVYHVGFDENYRTVRLDLPSVQKDTELIELCVDTLKLFETGPLINMAEIPSVKFDREDAARIAAGFDRLVDICPARAVP